MTRRTFLFDQKTNTKTRLNGVLPSARLPQKAKLQQNFASHMRFSAPQLPPKVDLRSEMTPVEDQSTVGSCVANSLAGAYEYLLRKTSSQNIDVSRLFIYYNARVKDNNDSENDLEDSGCTITSAIESLEELGTCLESIWPYNTNRANKRPSDEAYDAAVNNTINDALKLDIDLDEMKSCLAQGFPFVFGLKLFKSFNQARAKGIVPMPKNDDESRKSHGSHAMLAVGYSDHSKAFIVRNSWGSKWGDKGYCYIPYDYMASSTYCFDPWAVRQLDTDDMGHEHWDESDSVDYYEDDDEEDEEYDGEIEEEEVTEEEGEEEEE